MKERGHRSCRRANRRKAPFQFTELKSTGIGHGASVDGRELTLTLTEFKMLWTLASQPGRVFSRQELLDISRGDDANALERTIDVYVRSLRKTLGRQSELINAVRGVGYRMLIDRPGKF